VPFQAYRRVLANPGVPTSIALLFGARVPAAAMGLTLTLHIVSALDVGYGAAGLVGTAATAGNALGSPLLGRLIDRKGLRTTLALAGVASTGYWLAAPHLHYTVLLLITLPAGVLTVPAGSISRQVLTALVPQQHRRSAYSMDSIAAEISYMTGPAAGVLITTQFGSQLALSAIGIAFGTLAAILILVNPPVRSRAESAAPATARPPVRSWLRTPLVATLLIACGTMFVLVGTELATLASLRATGDVAWTGLVIMVMCAASLVGWQLHGGVPRSLSQAQLMLLLAVLVLPVGLVTDPWWLLAVVLIPTNLACAPTLSATTERISVLTPPAARGEAMGLQDSATRIGLSLGNPVIGFVIDHSTPAWGFAASGAGGLLLAMGAWLLHGRRSNPARETTVTHASR